MKRIVLVFLMLALAVTSYAGDKQVAEADANRSVFWVAAYGVVTIAADTEIAKGILAITPETDVEVYFGTDTANDFLISAGTTFAVNQRKVVKLKTQTVCLVY